MRKPLARPISPKASQEDDAPSQQNREPRAFAAPKDLEPIDSFEEETDNLELIASTKRKPNWLVRIILATGSLLISLSLALALERLIRDLYARYEWLGWFGLGITVLFVIVMALLALKEVFALRRLSKLDRLRQRATETLISDDAKDAQNVLAELQVLYAQRADMARARKELDATTSDLLDGSDMLVAAEIVLMKSLDDKAKVLTAAAARRVALVTAIFPPRFGRHRLCRL